MNQQTHYRGIALAIAAAVITSMTACSKTEQGAQPAANAPATPASGLENKSKDDLARIRELMEKEEARKQAQENEIKEAAKKSSSRLSQPIDKMGR